ncbi:MAG: DnaA ATPase domain-containing protein, partial [Treponemataceae bacterium]
MNSTNYDVFFKEVLSQIHSDFVTSNNDTEFTLWFGIHYISTKNENTILASVPTPFYKDQMVKKNYISLIESKFLEMYGKNIKLEIEFNPNILESPKTSTPSETTQHINQTENIEKININHQKINLKTHPSLREDYTFDTFVKSDNSNFAHSASIAVSKNPGKAYNPLLIYGGVGLGKTHLMQSIGNLAYNEDKKKIIY